MNFFSLGTITAYPTDTSFGLGVRADDGGGLQALQNLKKRSGEKYFSLMVKDFAMLQVFAEVPEGLEGDFFSQSPKTVILKPTSALPKSCFWPTEKVAFRVCTLEKIANLIDYPVTATSANISRDEPIFCTKKLFEIFGADIQIVDSFPTLESKPPSEIWDFTVNPVVRLR